MSVTPVASQTRTPDGTGIIDDRGPRPPRQGRSFDAGIDDDAAPLRDDYLNATGRASPGARRDVSGTTIAGHGAEAVRDAITRTIITLPEQLRQSLTWDQGALTSISRLRNDARSLCVAWLLT